MIEQIHDQFEPSDYPDSFWSGLLLSDGTFIPCLPWEHARMAAWALDIPEKKIAEKKIIRCCGSSGILKARGAHPFTLSQRLFLKTHGYMVDKREEFDGHMYHCQGLPFNWDLSMRPIKGG